MINVDKTRINNPVMITRMVFLPEPAHSFKNNPHRLLNTIMNDICMDQLAKSYFPILVVPIP